MAAEDGKNTSSEPSVEDLAKRLMDLWQEQMAAIAADPDLMRQMATMMAASPFPAMMQGIMQGVMAATANPAGQNPYEWWKGVHGPSAESAKPSSQARPQAAAPASQPGGGDLAELRRNLAGLEARLAELGGQGGGESKPSKPKRPARRSPKPVAGPAGGGGKGGTGGAGGGAAG